MPRVGVCAALLCVLIAIPVSGSAYIVQLATDILTFTTLAYSWNLISGFTGYLSFGQVSFFGLGAYITALLVLPHGMRQPSLQGLSSAFPL